MRASFRSLSTSCRLCGQAKPFVNVAPTALVNRNPRNLERLRIERKPEGWHLDTPSRAYWHKLIIKEGSRHLTAHVEHNNGRVVAQSSTSEWSFQKRLLSLKDMIAADALGKVLAERLLMAGITEVHSEFKIEGTQSEKIKNVLRALESCGISMCEPHRYEPPALHQAKPTDEKPWDTIVN